MAEDFFRVHKGITVANTSAAANLNPISLVLASLIANNTGVYAGIVNATSVFSTTVNAATHSVGTAFTANASLVNCAAINLSGQVNVGANVTANTTMLNVGNTTFFSRHDIGSFYTANSTSTLNMAPGLVQVGANVIANTTAIQVGPTVIMNTSMLAISGSAVALLAIEDQVVAGGARVTVKDLGTISSGTVTPDPGDRPIQKYTNNGGHILAPGANVGAYLLTIVNGASAGAITTSGWNKVSGDTFTTTNADKFRCHCSVTGDGSLLIVQALQ